MKVEAEEPVVRPLSIVEGFDLIVSDSIRVRTNRQIDSGFRRRFANITNAPYGVHVDR